MNEKRIKKLTLTALLLICFWVSGLSLVQPRGNTVKLSYEIEALPGEGFQVRLVVDGLDRGVGFKLLDGWGVVQDHPAHISDLTMSDRDGNPIGWTRQGVDGTSVWELEDGKNPGNVTLSYRVRSYDPELSPEASFVDQAKFVLVGYSVFLIPENIRHFEPATVSVKVSAPGSWGIWSSWPGDGETFFPGTTHDLWSGVLAGGGFRLSRLETGSVSVSVLTEDRINRTRGLSIANRLLPVLREMRDLFGAPPRGDSLRVLSVYRVQSNQNGLSMMSGNSEESAFLCLATPDRYRNADQLTVLATHECLHFYLGGAVTASPEPPFRNAPDMVWLMEGVTEYLTYKILQRAGIITEEALAGISEKKEREYRDTRGWTHLTLAAAARQMSDIEVYKLVYSRGFLVGQLLDREMTRKSGAGAFEAALKELFLDHNFYRQGVVVDPELVRSVFESHSPGIGLLIDGFASGNRTIPTRESDPAGKETHAGAAVPLTH